MIEIKTNKFLPDCPCCKCSNKVYAVWNSKYVYECLNCDIKFRVIRDIDYER